MRIIHFLQGRCNPDTANGVDKTVYYLAKTQAALGNEVLMLSETGKEIIPIPGAEVKHVPVWGSFLRISDEARAEIDYFKPEAGHFHSAYVPGNVSVSRYLRKIGVPYVVTPNGNLASRLLKRNPHLKIPYKLFFERPYINKAAFVHAVGDRQEIEKYGVKVPIVEALNGIDVSLIPGDLDTGLIEERIPEMAGRTVMVFVGRLDVKQKGIDLMLDALKEALIEAPDLALLLVGPNWKGYQPAIEEMIAQRGLDDVVKFWGPAYGKEKWDLLAAGDVFIHTSRWEGLPFAVIEAMACGKACLVTPAADPAGLLAANQAGALTAMDVGAIAKTMVSVAKNGDLDLDSLGQKARAVVERELAWEPITRTVMDGYAKYCNA